MAENKIELPEAPEKEKQPETQDQPPVEVSESTEEGTADVVPGVRGPLIIGSSGANMTTHSVDMVTRQQPAGPKNTVTILVKYPGNWKKPNVRQAGFCHDRKRGKEVNVIHRLVIFCCRSRHSKSRGCSSS
jgi:hypothetical protein